jgi:tetrapyrrole methylase family protein/MazG family protein/ATP diphosphatase
MADNASFTLPEPPQLEGQTGDSFSRLVSLMQRLLAPDGCPWDREQNESSLRRYVLEEACEVIDAIDAGDDALLCEELGDLALQVAFLSELARRRRAFGPDDVMLAICTKLVRRHPHVFGAVEATSPDQVEANWERIKLEEKAGRSLLDGVPRSLPALQRASQTSRRAAQVGFDWDDESGARRKVDEELGELDQARATEGAERVAEEFGDLLFAMVNWARHLGVEPEQALRQACDKFRSRFDDVEASVLRARGDWPRDERGKPTKGVPLDELERYWEATKTCEDESRSDSNQR